jgi:hypothetical protein
VTGQSNALVISNTVTTGVNITATGNLRTNANGIALGANAGNGGLNTAAFPVLIGFNAGANIATAGNVIKIGGNAGFNSGGGNGIAIGFNAGYDAAQAATVAIGNNAGYSNLGAGAIAIGRNAAWNSNVTGSSNNIAIGSFAQHVTVANTTGVIAIGRHAGNNASNNSIIIGTYNGNTLGNAIGTGAIAIGANAVANSASANSITLNATGLSLASATANAFYVNPIRQATSGNILFYDFTTKEVSHQTSYNLSNINAANVTGTFSNISSNGNIAITGNGNISTTNGGMSVVNQDVANVTQSLFVQTYNNANAFTGAWTSFRARGTLASPLPVQAGDNVMVFTSAVRADSSNTFVKIADIIANVSDNDGLGNVSGAIAFEAKGSNSRVRFVTPQIVFNQANYASSAILSGNGNLQLNGTLTAQVANIGSGNINLYANGEINTTGLITTTGNINANNANIGSGNIILHSNGYANANTITAFDVVANTVTSACVANVKMTFFGNGIFFTDQNLNSAFQISNSGSFTNQTYSVTKQVETAVLPQAFYSTAYNNANIQTAQISCWRARGNSTSPLRTQAGDYVGHFPYVMYADSGNTFAKLADVTYRVKDNDGAGNFSGAVYNDIRGANSQIINIAKENIFTLDNTTAVPNATIYGNGYINTNNRIEYLRTYGGFYNPNDIATTANTVANLDLPNTYDANGISIVSNNQITIQRTGTYNIQFSLQVKNTDNASDHDIDVWFAKNGTDVANSASQWTVVKNDGKNICVVNFVDTVTSANTYYQIRYAVNSANVSLEAFGNITTPYTRPAIPSAIVTVVPVGA